MLFLGAGMLIEFFFFAVFQGQGWSALGKEQG
jgi:hypothetical protein